MHRGGRVPQASPQPRTTQRSRRAQVRSEGCSRQLLGPGAALPGLAPRSQALLACDSVTPATSTVGEKGKPF